MNQPDVIAAIQAAATSFPAGQEGEQPAPGTERKFTLYTGAEILAMPRTRWRVKGMIPSEGLAAIFGQPGSAKTFVALDLAFAIAEGAEWFGLHTEPCPVVYINLESRSGLQKRLSAWQEEYRRTVPEGVKFVIEAFHILDDVEALAKDIPSGAVVFLDTLNAASPGLDENSSLDMGKILEAAKKLQNLVSGLVVLVHHTGKDGTKGLRGHSSLLAALDAAVEVSRNGDARCWRVTKAKEAEDGTRRGFRLKAVNIGFDEDGEPETSCVVEPDEGAALQEEKPLTPALKYALESLKTALREKGADAVHIEDWRAVFYAGHSADKTDSKKKAFNRARADLLSLAKISINNDNYSIFSTGQPGQYRDMSGTCPAPHSQTEPGQTGTHPFRVCPVSRCPDGGGSVHEKF